MDECVRSILAQTYSNLEIILVDDGSPDLCPQKCDKWAEKEARIRVIHKKNGGLSSARNAGVKVATGQYISFVDSDDIIEEHMFEELIRGFSIVNNVDITSIRIMRYIDGNLSDYNVEWLFDNPRIIKGKDFSRIIVEQTCCNTVCGKLYRAELCHKVAFKEGRNNEDTLFNYYIGKELKRNDTVAVDLPFPAYYYRMRPNSICTSTTVPLVFDTLRNLDEMIVDASSNNSELVGLLRKTKIHKIFNFVDSIILDKKRKELYYPQFRQMLKQVPYNELKDTFRTNDLCYVLMHRYCPWMRMGIRKLLQRLGHYNTIK